VAATPANVDIDGVYVDTEEWYENSTTGSRIQYNAEDGQWEITADGVFFYLSTENSTDFPPAGEWVVGESGNVGSTVTITEYVDAPTITSSASTTSITVTIDGNTGTTNYIKYKLSTASAWTDGGSRSGDGTVVLSDLPAGSYHIIGYSKTDYVVSTPSNLLTTFVSSLTTIEAAIYELLSSDAAIDAIVDGRVSPVLLATDDINPSITYQMLTAVRNHTFADSGNMVDGSFQIKCYADDYGTCRTLSTAVRNCLDNYAGTIGGVVIQCIHMDGEGDAFDMMEGITESKVFCKRLAFKVFYNE
jgi:hypothetical protein